jgi:hypothetical protein
MALSSYPDGDESCFAPRTIQSDPVFATSWCFFMRRMNHSCGQESLADMTPKLVLLCCCQIKVTAQQQWAKLHNEVSTLLQAADAARQDAVDAAERTKQGAKQQLQDADAKLAAAQAASQELEQQAAALQQQVAQLEAELDSVQAAHAQDESSLAQSQQRCSSLAAELATATSRAAAFQQQCSALQLALAAAKEEVVRLQPEEQPWALERRGLEAQVAALKAKKTATFKQLVTERRLRSRAEQLLQGHRASQAALQAKLQKAAAAGERSASSAAELEGKAQRAEQLAARLDERRCGPLVDAVCGWLPCQQRCMQRQSWHCREMLGYGTACDNIHCLETQRQKYSTA